MSDLDNQSPESEISQVLDAIRANTDAILKMAQAMCMLADALIDVDEDHEPASYLDGSPL